MIGAGGLAVASAASAVTWARRRSRFRSGRCASSCWSGTAVLLALFLHVGVFKGASVFDALPVDVTAALGLLLAGVCLPPLEGRVRPVPVGVAAPVALIGIFALIGLIWTPMADYGTEKAVKFLTLTVVAASRRSS